VFNFLLFGFGSENDAFFLGGGMMVGISEECFLLIAMVWIRHHV
jgi:hypothetical protein